MPEYQQIQKAKDQGSTFQKHKIHSSSAHHSSQAPVSNPLSIIQRAKINPKSLTHADVMQLQHTIGNRAVGMLLSGIGNFSTAQKATVQRQEIPEEEELLQGKMIETVQKQEIPEEEEPLQEKMIRPLQLQEIPEEENLLQGKMAGTIQRQEMREEEEPLQAKRENRTGIPDNLKAGVESLSGIDLNDVKVHYNSSKPAEVRALAYTQGTEIHVAPGQERHLPHEAWHVVQQKQGRVQPTVRIAGMAINDSRYLEKEADLMGGKAAKTNVGLGRIKEAKSQFVPNLVTQHKSSVNQNFRISDSPLQMIGINRQIIQRQGTSDFEGILRDKPEKKKEHNVLVYGTEDSREKLRGEKGESLPTGFSDKGSDRPVGWATAGYYTVDRYNNYSWRDFAFHGESRFSIYNPDYVLELERFTDKSSKKNKIKEDLKTWTGNVTPGEEKNEVKDYQDNLLSHSSYSPLTTFFEGEDFVKSKEGAGDIAKSKFQLQTRRASKFGLQYMKDKQGQIAFISWVDQKIGLPANSDFVLNKTKSTNRPAGKTSGSRVPITVSEKRKLFRIRHGDSGINFYDGNGKLIKAPWNKGGDKRKWREYDERRRLKYQDLLENKLSVAPKSENIEDLKKQLREELDKIPEYKELSLSEAISKLMNTIN